MAIALAKQPLRAGRQQCIEIDLVGDSVCVVCVSKSALIALEFESLESGSLPQRFR